MDLNTSGKKINDRASGFGPHKGGEIVTSRRRNVEERSCSVQQLEKMANTRLLGREEKKYNGIIFSLFVRNLLAVHFTFLQLECTRKD